MSILLEWLSRAKEHASVLALIATWAGFLFVYLRRRRHWTDKEFHGLVNFSLNYVAQGKLVMRTLHEAPANEVWPNEYGVKLVLAACKQTTADQPFVLLNQKDDLAYVNRAVLNKLSECFAEVYLAESLGLPVTTGEYLYALTYERYEIMRTRKLRVLLIEASLLQAGLAPGGEVDALPMDAPTRQRLQTLQAMYSLLQQEREQQKTLLGRIVLGVPKR